MRPVASQQTRALLSCFKALVKNAQAVQEAQVLPRPATLVAGNRRQKHDIASATGREDAMKQQAASQEVQVEVSGKVQL